MKRILLITALALWATPSLAQSQSYMAERYQDCLALVESDPNRAFDMAIEWRDNGGGMPPRHCAALALVELGLYPEAAERLEELAVQPGQAGAVLRAQIFAQAAMAYALNNDQQKSYGAFNRAIDMLRRAEQDTKQNLAPILIDMANVYLMFGDGEAVLDTTRELIDTLIPFQDSIMADAYALRASALRGLGDKSGANDEAIKAMEFNEQHPRALYERGIYAKDSGDTASAQKFLLAAIDAGAGTEMEELARRAFQGMALGNPEPAPTPVAPAPSAEGASTQP